MAGITSIPNTRVSDQMVRQQFAFGESKVPMNAANLCPSPRVVAEQVAELTRDIDGTIEGLRGMLSGTKGEAGDVFERIRLLLAETQGLLAAARPILQDAQLLLTEAKPVLQDAKVLAADARQLIADNKAPISQAILQLDKSASAIEKLATSGNKLVVNNEKKLNALISDFKVSSENLKVTSTYAKILVRSLSQRPSQLIWGTSRPPPLPSEQQILQSTRPLPAD